MNSLPAWLPIGAFLISLLSLSLSFWAATRSISARSSAKQLEVLQDKLKHEQKLTVAIEHRPARDQPAITEVILHNLNSSIIFIYGATLNDTMALDLESLTSNLIQNTLKPGEGTPILQFADLAKVSGNLKNHLDGNGRGLIELYIFLASDPNFMHTHIITYGELQLRSDDGKRITLEAYEELVARLKSR